ncbi:uncharacterized protein BN601_01336 [Coraliomargarita sp. CAG:312]|nr:uncharacterized protein BN601_01336 [Coraliomargarita sp. CAG:312]
MDRFFLIFFVLFAFISALAAISPEAINADYTAGETIFRVADTDWNPDMRGNHRAVLRVSDLKCGEKFVRARIGWRRPDLRAETKKIIVVCASTGKEVENVFVKTLNNEFGEIVFEAVSGAGEYFAYYLPYKFRARHADARYANLNDYLKPEYKKFDFGDFSKLPLAQTLAIESRNAFEYFTDMGTIATSAETEAFLKKYSARPLIFTEDRVFPMRLSSRLCTRWLRKGPSEEFYGEAMKNEYYVWQICVWAADSELKNVKLKFSDLKKSDNSARVKSSEITCFNMGGTNWDGKAVSFRVDVPKGKFQALWCGAQIPEDAPEGLYSGTALLTADGIESREIAISIKVCGQILEDKGDSELWRHSRLRWLNSSIGISDDPVAGFEQIYRNGSEIRAAGKIVKISKNGLPQSIKVDGREVLEKTMQFSAVGDGGEIVFDGGELAFGKVSGGSAEWSSRQAKGGLVYECSAKMEFDGFILFKVSISAENPVKLKDLKFKCSYTPYASEYFMGAGFDGGLREPLHEWDFSGRWDSCWIGNALAGLHTEFRGSTYHGPLIGDYSPKPPNAWFNGGRGILRVSGERGSSATLEASRGETELRNGKLEYEFAVLATPMKKLNTSKHFSERYAHCPPKPFEKAFSEGANISNLHHANEVNPYINYPFIVRDELIDYIKKQHSRNCRVKLYYTVRELTNHAAEIYALRSLGHEIFSGGEGYDMPWQCEHLIDDYRGAWYTRVTKKVGPYEADSAIQLSGFSRWINYYLEGLDWMLRNYDIDGIYMDDVSFDRTVVKRIRRILDSRKSNALIDLHSNTAYSNGPAVQYADFFPYVDRLWFGESFKYDKMSPDQWLVRFSGIPFGVMSEMLQDGGNRFLGMVYGTTGRHSYTVSPAPVWKLWREFSIEKSEMIGYWDERCPVKTSDINVKATAYVKSGEVLISLGNFGDNNSSVSLEIDFSKLGINRNSAVLYAPKVEDFQDEKTYSLVDKISIPPKKGALLILK